MDVKDSGMSAKARSLCYAARCFTFDDVRAKGREAIAAAPGCSRRALTEIEGAIGGWPNGDPDRWEQKARGAAHAMPTCDHGSTRAIQDVARLLREAYAEGLAAGRTSAAT